MKSFRSLIRKKLGWGAATLAVLLLLGLAACTPAGELPTQPVSTPVPPLPITVVPSDTPRPPTPTLAPIQTLAPDQPGQELFNGERAYADVLEQVGFGARHPGTEGHDRMVEFMLAQLEAAGWEGQVQETEYGGQPVRNVTGRRAGPEEKPWILLGAHYDSRMFADADPDPANHTRPVPAANDGGSGVAVLLELARVLPADLPANVWLVFFDAEDNGNIEGWDWILGSRAYAEALEEHPDMLILVDMIGDADLNIYYERSSNASLMNEIWSTARQLGYDQFIPEYKYQMIDDHTPFLELGIPAVDIIDFDYPYWHTVEDTPDKVSAESLEAVGRTLQTWLLNDPGQSLRQ